MACQSCPAAIAPAGDGWIFAPHYYNGEAMLGSLLIVNVKSRAEAEACARLVERPVERGLSQAALETLAGELEADQWCGLGQRGPGALGAQLDHVVVPRLERLRPRRVAGRGGGIPPAGGLLEQGVRDDRLARRDPDIPA